ncbi:MAG: orotidine-5'-phosphate decarboxylase [Lachnospiraceae bacterium]|nr:orotidine-5'-phosphate decarboxylase [Lachnospiraceae bacterium]
MMNRLADLIRRKNAPVVVGLDPQLSFIPDRILRPAYMERGDALGACALALMIFNKEIIDAVYDLVPAVKLQSAMYEMFGVSGIDAYRDTISYAHGKGLIVMADVKRGDIGSTSEAYAKAHLGSVDAGGHVRYPFDADIATVNPYLGTDGIQPFLDVCRAEGKGIFVLVKTSNPSGKEFQDLICEGRPLYEHVAERMAALGESVREGEYSLLGAVTGATYPEEGRRLRELMPHQMLLVPGYGAQGATGRDLRAFFKEDGTGAIINSSRGIIAAWQKEAFNPEHHDDAGACARLAVQAMIGDLRKALD